MQPKYCLREKCGIDGLILSKNGHMIYWLSLLYGCLLTGELVAVVHLGLPVAGLPVDVEGEAGGAAHGGQADGAGRARSVASAMVPCEMGATQETGYRV